MEAEDGKIPVNLEIGQEPSHQEPPPERDVALKEAIKAKENHDSVLVNPLAGLPHDKVKSLGEVFVFDYDLADTLEDREETVRLFRTSAVLAQNNQIWKDSNKPHLALTTKDLICLRQEETQIWYKLDQSRPLYFVIIACALSAAAQGWNETAPNGANLFYQYAFGLEKDSHTMLYGLVNGAPYLCCAVLGCWLTYPLNYYFGRKKTIFLCSLISIVTCLGQSFTDNWKQMFAARFLLGLAIGPKSATAPIWAAECAPARIRGRLVMMWQMFTAFGIALGFIAGAALYNVGGIDSDPFCNHGTASREALVSQRCSINWRLMMGSQILLPIILCVQIWLCPESPRWYIKKGDYKAAFRSLIELRNTKVQAARDLFYMHCLITAERHVRKRHNRLAELFTVPRNRRAATASVIVMFLQQLCGVNVIVYYSSEVIYDATGDRQQALLASMGFGILNFLFAFPAFKYIDSWGRRTLLLITFPFMALFMLLTGLAFLGKDVDVRAGLVLTGIYLFAIVYSPGEGPVPFTYSAECHSLHVRDLGMSLATSVTWTFNFILNCTWPSINKAFTTTGGFGWYSAWNVVGFFLILFFVPETKHRTLEELDKVFEISTRDHITHGIRQFFWVFGMRKEKPLLACDEIMMHEDGDWIGSMLAFPVEAGGVRMRERKGYGYDSEEVITGDRGGDEERRRASVVQGHRFSRGDITEIGATQGTVEDGMRDFPVA